MVRRVCFPLGYSLVIGEVRLVRLTHKDVIRNITCKCYTVTPAWYIKIISRMTQKQFVQIYVEEFV